MQLPLAFRTQLVQTFGERGATFLQELPERLDYFAQRWQLTLDAHFPNLSFNYVAPARRSDGSEAVLKLGVPHRESFSEHAALAFFNGVGCVQLLDAVPEQAALLLERLHPGDQVEPLAFTDDAKATSILAGVMQTLWKPAPPSHSMLTIGLWAEELQMLRSTFQGGTGPYPPHLVDAAEQLFAELLASSSTPFLLHGDLHHGNVLSDGTQWRAIDPKGVAGDREFEVYALLRNPWGWPRQQPNLTRSLERRLDQLADLLPLDRERMRLWSAAQCVLSAWWDYTPHDPAAGQEDLRVAESLLSLQGTGRR